MIFHFIPRIGRAFAATILFGAVAFVLPSVTSVAMADDAQAAKPMPGHHSVEARIKSLHDGLQITATQEPQWQAVAEVMRDNAKATGALIRERAANINTMTAVDDLHSYQAIAEAHASGIQKLIPAFEALYASMSDAQKTNADRIFRHQMKRSSHRKSG